MKYKLPKDWKWVKLEDVCLSASSNLSQKKLVDDNGEFPVYGASGFIKNVSFYHREEDYISIIKDGAGVGRIAIHKAKSSVIGTLQYLIPKENVEIRYLFYFLLGVDFKKYISGSTIPHIYYRHYKDEDFLLIPIKEQLKIVKVLDAILGKIDQVITLVNQNIEKLEQLNASVLGVVFKGLKTPKFIWDDVLTIINGKNQRKVQNPNGKYPIYGSGGIMNYADDYLCPENTVIVGRKGTINNPLFIETKFWNVDTAFGICAGEKLNPKFLYYFCRNFNFKNLNKSTTLPSLAKRDLLKIKMIVPALNKQKQIVKYLDHTTEKNNQLIQHYQNKLQSLQDLKKSVLDSAFKGKLKREVIKVVKEVKVIKFKELYPDPYIRKQRVAQKHKLKRRQVFTTTRIIDLHQKHNQKLGHTKTEKINHAIEYLAQCELGRDPVKNTGGPVDFYYTMKFVEPFAKEKEVFEAVQTEKGYVYNAKDNFDLFVNLSYQDNNLKPYNASIDAIINNFLFLSLREAELYITVYTGWNNLIIRKQDVNLNSIYTESIELWIDKVEKFNDTDVKNALKWLKSKNYIPVGYGKEVK